VTEKDKSMRGKFINKITVSQGACHDRSRGSASTLPQPRKYRAGGKRWDRKI